MAEDEVHIWRAAIDVTDSFLRAFEEALAPDEQARAGRFRLAPARDRFVAARGRLRIILARYLDTDPRGIRFRYGPHGKPALVDAQGDIRFNLSHSGGMALYALARGREIGIDIERIRPRPIDASIGAAWFTPEENAALLELAAHERQERFFRSWTRREACLKARGEGLAGAPGLHNVTLLPGDPLGVGNSEGIDQRASRWFLRELDPGPGYAAAVAAEGPRARLTFADWPP